MTHPSIHARRRPDRTAAVFIPSQRTLSYGELESGANQAARLLQQCGVTSGDAIVFCIENAPAFLFLGWACQRIGVRYVPASTKLSADDLAYIVRDAGAAVVVLSATAESAGAASEVDFAGACLFSLGSRIAGFDPWEERVAACPSTLPESTAPGREMMYSSGTTGRPKGVRKPMPTGPFDGPDSRNLSWPGRPGVGQDMVSLCTAPLYHAAPHRNVAATLAMGGTCIVMERFDAALALDAISRFKVTHSQWVPTMFHRLLRLPAGVRQAHDLSSHQAAHHGAAPCPVHVKEAMIAWWGPILFEYYAGTEGIGACAISSEEWLSHKGSVGRATDGIIHILDENEQELPSGRTGTVFFEGTSTFAYWKDEDKTARSRSRQGWWTYGDIGHVDDEGYLYLSDRRDFVVISGGVNIYPQEIEAFLLRDENVLDAAVFGIPDEELGEAVQAIVQVRDSSLVTAAVSEALRQQCRLRLGPIKTPKSIRLVTDFPRLPTGKLQKMALREQFLNALARERADRDRVTAFMSDAVDDHSAQWTSDFGAFAATSPLAQACLLSGMRLAPGHVALRAKWTEDVEQTLGFGTGLLSFLTEAAMQWAAFSAYASSHLLELTMRRLGPPREGWLMVEALLAPSAVPGRATMLVTVTQEADRRPLVTASGVVQHPSPQPC